MAVLTKVDTFKMSEKNKKPEDEVVTIRDFKSMIVGMDMIMGEDWTPNESQWKRIRKKIDALIETSERPMHDRPIANQPVVRGSDLSEAKLAGNFPQIPAPENIPIGEAAPGGQSALTPTPRPPAPVTPRANAPIADGRERVKTPDIDSSDGYKSSFV